MSDHFGIGTAILGASRIYMLSARGTGRTTSLVESVKDGDRIIFATRKESERVSRLLKERGLNVDCVAYGPDRAYGLFRDLNTSEGRTIFDHTWVEQFFERAIQDAQRQIESFQKELSGFGTAHYETRRKAAEIFKWRMGE